MPQTVLIVDDDAKLIDLLTEYFGENEFIAHAVMLGADALDAIRDNQPDIVILDIMLPDTNGLEVLKQIRAKHTIPVIMLTAKGDDTDRIVGLELGADDYLPKPFNPRELLARIRAILRRQDRAEPESDTVIIRAGDLELNRSTRTLIFKGQNIPLSTTEFNVLEVLMKHPNTVLSREQITNMAQGRSFMADDRSVDIHVSKLRGKIEKNPSSPVRIKTIWGTGYMFINTDS
ncbi:response regulator transcription factor [uncultured Desulfobacter sp.]|uniref:response regulator transcription factor n=1 Tax=uncultured Desulfobacter sp. TaxID=240139 RepID=UPI0029F4C292|nr:response regulator transcription factor [uncultured Desulfobacter sp.]